MAALDSPDSSSSSDAYSSANRPIYLAFVEDDDDYREVVSSELTDLGFVVESFRDGLALLDSVTAGTMAEIVLLDWTLPNVSGLSALGH